MNPEQAASRSNAAARVRADLAAAPGRRWTGNGMSGVMVATMIRSIWSAVTPAFSMARRAALAARSEVNSSGGGDAALLDAGAGGDPLVGGVDHFLQVGVGQDRVGHIGADAGDGAGAALKIVLGARVFEIWVGCREGSCVDR